MIDNVQKELSENGIVRFIVKAKPNASQSRVIEVMDDESIKIAVAAPAEQGKANVELINFLSREFCVPISNIRLVAGATARTKIIEIRS